MAIDLIHDRGRGPEIDGTRITIYHLLPYFLNPSATEAYIARVCALNPEQVAAARAYVLAHAELILAEHFKIEDRNAAGNSPQLIEQTKRTHADFLTFREWLAARQRAEAALQPSESEIASNPPELSRFPTFREWLAQRDSRNTDEK